MRRKYKKNNKKKFVNYVVRKINKKKSFNKTLTISLFKKKNTI